MIMLRMLTVASCPVTEKVTPKPVPYPKQQFLRIFHHLPLPQLLNQVNPHPRSIVSKQRFKETFGVVYHPKDEDPNEGTTPMV